MLINDLISEFSYEEAEVALYDPNMRMRTLMRGMLLTIGFRSITESRNARDVVTTMKLHPIDLLIIDLDHEPDQICGVVRDIREGAVGTNPYIVIIGLTGKPEKEMISRSLNTGIDDLIAKPISPKILSERTTNLVRNRRDFVVTTSYIGPDRRGKERRNEGDLESIKVPNTLRHKATGDNEAIADTQALDGMQHQVNMHRIYCLARKISKESEKIENELAVSRNGRVPSWKYRDLAEKISTVNRIIAAENVDVLEPISGSMQAVVKSIYASEQPTARHFAILRLHGEAIGEAIKDERAAAKLIAQALEQTVELKRSYRARPAKRSEPDAPL